MFFILLLPLFHLTRSTNIISVYGDVYRDRQFFNQTFPWIIDNIGGELMVDFYMQGSGRYTVPQMCALGEMRSNTFLQAQYLKCEAEGHQSEYCLCRTGINPLKFKQCVNNKGSLAATAAAKFAQVGIDVTPLIELGPRSTVFKVDDSWYLKKICTIFGDNQPRGCVKPFACNGTEALSDKKALAQFGKCCQIYCPKPAFTSTPQPEPEFSTTALPDLQYLQQESNYFFDERDSINML